MKKLIPILFLACLLQACGHSNSEARDQDAFAARVKSAPEISSIDNDLDELESETAG